MTKLIVQRASVSLVCRYTETTSSSRDKRLGFCVWPKSVSSYHRKRSSSILAPAEFETRSSWAFRPAWMNESPPDENYLPFFLVKGWSFLVNTRGRIVTCVALTFRYYLWVILFLALFCPFNLSSIEVKDVQLGHQHFKTSRGSMTLPRNFHIFAIWVSRTIAWRYTSENGRRPVNLWLH